MNKTSLATEIQNILDSGTSKQIVLSSKHLTSTLTLLRDIEQDALLGKGTWSYRNDAESIEDFLEAHTSDDFLIIPLNDLEDSESIRSIIKSYSIDGCCLIVTNEPDRDILVSDVSFRDFLEGEGIPFSVPELLEGSVNTERMETTFQYYLLHGSVYTHLVNPESIHEDFSKKLESIYQDLFPKEYEQFLEFFRTLIMMTGELHKADGLAKTLGISRRKIHKYTDILIRHGMIDTIVPYSQDAETETTRHTKIYFTDLGIFGFFLGNTAYHGTLKKGGIENFVYLELKRKLFESHNIYFYRKKSGAEVNFLLENKNNRNLTPIEITLRDTEHPSQALKNFTDTYQSQIDRVMILGQKKALKKEIAGIPLFVLPAYAI